MIKLLYALLFIAGCVFAANDTPSLVPRGDGQGSIGSADASWSTGSFKRIFIDGQESAPIPEGTNVGDYIVWNGTNWISGPNPYINESVPYVGSNKLIFGLGTNVNFPYTNVWTNTVSTQLLFTLWGGSGSGAANAGGHVRGFWQGPTGTVFDIIVASETPYAAGTNSGPGSGRGLYAQNYTDLRPAYYWGGGYSAIRINGTTNYILVAGGSGAGITANTSRGGPGGSLSSTYGRIHAFTTNLVSSGYNAAADNEVGLNAIAGTNQTVLSDGSADGGFLRGGNFSTNGSARSQNVYLGGGGGGWYGGAGAAFIFANYTNTTVQAAGGGGLNYINTNYIMFGFSFQGGISSSTTVSPIGTDHPTYVSGVGVGNTSATATGSKGGAGVMW